MRLFFGLMIFLIGAVVAGPLRVAFIMLPLFVLITPTFLYGARFAVPYVSAVVPLAVIVLLLTPGAGRIAHAIVSGGAMLMIVASFMAAEHRTRSLARSNRTLAYSDPLTGIANTRRLRERLAAALGSADGKDSSFALFAIDLDNFKLVNDTFDHTTGDTVLKAVADALAGEVGADDLVARRGGDEFSVLIAHPAGIDMPRLTARLSGAIERARLSTCPSITPSGSVAHVLAQADDSISTVLQRADDELHTTKRAFHAEHGERDAFVVPDSSEDDAPRLRVVDREAALQSVSAAVSRAYGSPRRRHSGGRHRWAGIKRYVASMDPIWGFMAAVTGPTGIVFLVLTITNAFAPMPMTVGILSSLTIMAVSGFSLWAARRGLNKRWVILCFLAMLVAMTAMTASAGRTGAALIDAYVVVGLFGFYFLRTRQAFAVMLISAGLFAGFAVGGDYAYGEIRTAITLSVIFVAAGIVMKVRSVTLGFVRTNRELSEIDALTGVANLRALKLRVETTLANHAVGDQPPVLMTVDLDRFKLVNDRYNHTTGDQVLAGVARAVSECVRMDEMVARRGGDEFFVLFEHSTSEHIMSVIPRVREAVQHARSRVCPDLTSTATVGFVVWKPGQDADAFMSSADGVMHDEKIDTRAHNYSESAA
jgi:diguanylate cyclase (GGDEF)-like protein